MNTKTLIKDFEIASISFIETVKSIDLIKPVYRDGWNAKQIISHVIFYQVYYTSIVKAIINEIPLPLIDESLAKVNIRSSKEYLHASRSKLLTTFTKESMGFVECIKHIAPNKRIPYKKGGRIYTSKQYLREITRHLIKHTEDLNRTRKVY